MEFFKFEYDQLNKVMPVAENLHKGKFWKEAVMAVVAEQQSN